MFNKIRHIPHLELYIGVLIVLLISGNTLCLAKQVGLNNNNSLGSEYNSKSEKPLPNVFDSLGTLSFPSLVISNVEVEINVDYMKSSKEEEIRTIKISFDYQIWQPDDPVGGWEPIIIVHISEFTFGSVPSTPSWIPSIDKYDFPCFIGPPYKWTSDENWDKKYPGTFGSAVVEGDVKLEWVLPPDVTAYTGVYFAFDPYCSSTADTLEELKEGTLDFHLFEKIKIENSLVIKPGMIDFGGVHAEAMSVPILLAESRLGSYWWLDVSDLHISNILLAWRISTNVDWLKVSPSIGNVSVGRALVVATADSNGLLNSHLDGEIVVCSNLGIVTIPVKMTAYSNGHYENETRKTVTFQAVGNTSVSSIRHYREGSTNLTLSGDFKISAGLSFPLEILVIHNLVQENPSAKPQFELKIGASGTYGGRAWLNLFGRISGYLQSFYGNFSFGYGISQVDIYNWLSKSDTGWSIDFNRLMVFETGLGESSLVEVVTEPIVIYKEGFDFGGITVSASFSFSLDFDSSLSGDLFVSGSVENPVTLPFTYSDRDELTYNLPLSQESQSTGDYLLNISSDNLEYKIENVNFYLTGLTLVADLYLFERGTLGSSSFTLESGLLQSPTPIIRGEYGPLSSNFSISRSIEELDFTKPTAILRASKTTLETGELGYFHGYKSTDNREIVVYYWDFGDGTKETTYGGDANIQHIYEKSGTYIVTLRVADKAGNYNEDTMIITVEEPNWLLKMIPELLSNPWFIIFLFFGIPGIIIYLFIGVRALKRRRRENIRA